MTAIDPARFTKVYDLTGDGRVTVNDVNREFALRFAKQSPQQRVRDVSSFSPAVREALSRELTVMVLDPRRVSVGPTEVIRGVSEQDAQRIGREKEHTSTEYLQRISQGLSERQVEVIRSQIRFSIEALKTLASNDPKTLEYVIESLVNRQASSTWAGADLIDVLEYAYNHGGARGKIIDGLKIVADSNRYAESHRAFQVLNRVGVQGYEELPPHD
jgi:hypothetical protein